MFDLFDVMNNIDDDASLNYSTTRNLSEGIFGPSDKDIKAYKDDVKKLFGEELSNVVTDVLLDVRDCVYAYLASDSNLYNGRVKKLKTDSKKINPKDKTHTPLSELVRTFKNGKNVGDKNCVKDIEKFISTSNKLMVKGSRSYLLKTVNEKLAKYVELGLKDADQALRGGKLF